MKDAAKPLFVLPIDREHCAGVEIESSHGKSKASVQWAAKALLSLGEAGSSTGAIHTCVQVLSQFSLLYQPQHVCSDFVQAVITSGLLWPSVILPNPTM